MNKLIWLVAFCLLSAACATGRRGAESAPSLYDLGPVTRPAIPDNERYPGVALEVRMPIWLEGSAIQYRLLFDDRMRVREYARARWAASPAILLQQRLRQHLGLPTVEAGVASSCLLSVEIDEFGQIFSSPTQSHASIVAEARWLTRGRRVVARQRIQIEQPAVTLDAPGGVTALTLATGAMASQLGQWLQRLAKDGKMSACQAP